MTTRFTLTTASALALALFASVPAMADCRSVMVTEVYGNDGDYDTRARDCAYWGVYSHGDGHVVKGTVAGPGSRVVTGSLGRGTRTDIDSRGRDARIATEARKGASIKVFNRGSNQIAARGGPGSRISVTSVGSGTSIIVTAE